ncbi:MAG: histidine--tRNA ligase [Candidatus Omnitrophota bacterium]|nr:histidine--tRNA ligase [Candidatus Omnitrophota bacterium]
MYQALRGTYDLLPAEAERLRSFLNRAISILERAGFRELETPIIEEARLFNRSIGEGSDIVSKEMYTFRDRKNRLLALRPEGTVSIVRAYLEHNFSYSNPAARFYYFGPMFRYDRPQKERYRQFLQLGVEVFASGQACTDGEVIFILSEIMNTAEIGPFTIQVNSLGCRTCQDNYGKTLAEFLEKRKEVLCEDCRNRLQNNPLRTLDCKASVCRDILKEAPVISNSLCPDCGHHFKMVLKYLDGIGIRYRVAENLVRGLDYYTRTVWEVTADNGENAIAAGGRYDNLVADLGGPQTAALGFAIGLERILGLMPSVSGQRSGIRLIYLDAASLEKSFGLMISLRKSLTVPVTLSAEEKSLKAQLRLADKDNCRFALIFGPEELERGEVILRDLDSSTQESIREKDLIERLK